MTPWPFPYDCVATTAREECVYEDAQHRRRVARFTVRVEVRFPGGPVGQAATVPAGVVAVSAESREPEKPSRPYVATARRIGKGGAKRVFRPVSPHGADAEDAVLRNAQRRLANNRRRRLHRRGP